MRRSLLPLLLAFTVLCGFTLAWKEFRSTEGRFSVSMPGTPEVETREVPSDLGPLSTHVFTATEKSIPYVVAYTDYPVDSPDAEMSATILNGARDGVVKSLGATVVKEKEIQLDGHPGKDLEMTSGPLRLRAKIYLVGVRLYQVLSVAPKAGKVPKSVDRFLASFKLTEQAN